MSQDLIQDLVDQLEDEDPKVRRRAARFLGRLADPRAITHLSNVYLNEQEAPSVKKAAGEALGVFRAMQEALGREEDVVIPDPETVRMPRFSPEALRRVLIALVTLLVVVWAVNGLLLLSRGGGASGVGQSYQALLGELQRRYDLALADVQNQRTAWQALQNSGQLDCTVPVPSTPGMEPLQIDAETYPVLYEANLALAEGITRLTLAANTWQYVGCQEGVGVAQSEAAVNLQYVEQAAASLEEARGWLDQAQQAAPTAGPTVEEGGPETSEPPTQEAVPTAAPTPGNTPLPLDVAVYRHHINEIRERIDLMLGGRGVVTLLGQYWADVRSSGQTGGCSQALSVNDLAPYTLPPEVAGRDLRLDSAVNILNVGLDLAHDSLSNFQQGCQNRDFSAVLSVGEQRIQAAVQAFTQVSALLNQIQAEVGP